jgi:hemerythrin
VSVFAWSEKYSVNIQEIDNQHRRLIEMVDKLHTAMRQGPAIPAGSIKLLGA